MKKIIALLIFTLLFGSFCFADGLPVSDVIKEAREKANISKTTTDTKKETSNVDNEASKQEIKDNVTNTLDDLTKVN